MSKACLDSLPNRASTSRQEVDRFQRIESPQSVRSSTGPTYSLKVRRVAQKYYNPLGNLDFVKFGASRDDSLR